MTKFVERKIKEYKDIPYTMVGHSSLMSEFSIYLKREGLIAIVNKMKETDDGLRITISEKKHDFEIVNKMLDNVGYPGTHRRENDKK